MKTFWVKIQLVVLLNILRSGCSVLTELETPEREAILKPRHFNPHPYEYSNRFDKSLVQRQIQPVSTSIFNQGPIQFPPINQGNTPKRSNNPYADIALKNRQKKLQRIVGFDNNILPTTYIIRSKFNKKILGGPAQRLDYAENIYDDYSTRKKQYAFSYTVKDIVSGDDFSHTQQQKDGAVSGSYKVHLPDGRTQVVRYRADDNGYQADVSYNVDKVLPTPRPTFNYLKGFNSGVQGTDQSKNFNYNLYIGQPVTSSTLATPVGTIPTYNAQREPIIPDDHLQSYNAAPEVYSRSSADILPTSSATIYHPTSYHIKTTAIPQTRISFVSTTPASPYQDITVVPVSELQASINPYGAKKASAIDPSGNYENGNTAPSSTYAANYDYDYDREYKISDYSASTESTPLHKDDYLDSNRVALYFQTKK